MFDKERGEKRKMTKRAQIENGNKDYRHRVFAIKGAKIIKSWDTEAYMKLSLSEIKRQLEVRNQHFRSTPW